MTIPDNLKPTSFGTVYSETELRQALANGEVQQMLGVGGGGGGGDASAANQAELIANIGDITDSEATTDTGNFSLISLIKRLLSVKLDRNLSQIETAIDNFLFALPMQRNEGIGYDFEVNTSKSPLGNTQNNSLVLTTSSVVIYNVSRAESFNCQFQVANCDASNPITVRFDLSLEDNVATTFWSNLAPGSETFTYTSNGVFSVIADKLACHYVRLFVVSSPGTATITRTLFNSR